MRRRLLLVALGVLAVLSAVSVVGPAGRAAPKPPTPAAPTTRSSVVPSPPPAAGPSAGSHTLTRTERAILLVTLTFLVGAGLLGPADADGEHRTGRPAITLYDDPALVERAAPTRRPAGEPPPLR